MSAGGGKEQRLEARRYVADCYGSPAASTDPGPLFIRWRVVDAESLNVICEGIESKELAQAFAAAPALVEALKAMVEEDDGGMTAAQAKAALRAAGVVL